MAVKEKLTIENARICYKNFAGKATDYNAEGARNFSVILDDDQAEVLAKDGWPIKTRPPREGFEDEGNFNTMKVTVKFGANAERNPKIFRICNGHKVLLNENTVACLDFDSIDTIDMRIRPYNWERANKSGTSAYLESMYVTVEDDPLAAKYETVEDNFTDPEEAPF